MLEAILAGFFGLIIGSFLNVCVYRMPRDLSVARPVRSFCPSCGHTITWYDNIPVASYLFLRGRCRHCGAGIPFRYLAVEFATGALFFAYVLWLGPTVEALKFCAYGAIMVALIAMDLEERILADEFTLGGILLGIGFAALTPIPGAFLQLLAPPEWSSRMVSILESVFSAVALSTLFWTIGAIFQKLRGREGLGFGDVKMVGTIGAFQGLSGALLAVAVGSVLGSVCGLLYIAIRKKDTSTYELPFGSFLGLGALLVTVWLRAEG